MVELQIYAESLPGREQDLEEVFKNVFVPAISVQEGFVRVEMLKAQNSLLSYRINLSFESEELRLKWVASREHQKAFPQIAALCQRVSWEGFEIIAAAH